jgi:hypothetical protein
MAGLELRGRGLAYPASLVAISAGWIMRSNRQPLVQLCGKLLRERKVCTSDILAFASSHDQPRSGPNNSERESTSGRSTNYGSGHLIRVFRDIGRIFSLLFLLGHPSPVGHRAAKWFQLCFVRNSPRWKSRACHSPKNEHPALRVSAKSGVSGTLMYGLG